MNAKKNSRKTSKLLPTTGGRTHQIRQAIRKDINASRQREVRKQSSATSTTSRQRTGQQSRPKQTSRGRIFEHPQIPWVGPYSNRTIRTPSSHVEYKDKDDQVVAISHLPNTFQEYQRTNIVPLAKGSTLDGVRASEYHYTERGRSGVLVKGRTFLTSLSVVIPGEPIKTGQRMMPSINIAPRSIGGRLAYFADLYHNQRVIKLRLMYEPTCSATTDGAIIFQYRPEDAMNHTDTGQAALIRAATSDYFTQTPVWDEAHLDIRPMDTLKEYFTDDSGEARLTIQGCIEAFAASDLGAAEPFTFGNLFLLYEIEFQKKMMAPHISAIQSTSLLELNSPTGVITGHPPVMFSGISSPLSSFITFGGGISSLSLDDNPGNWMLEFCVIKEDFFAGLWTATPFPETGFPYWDPGQVFYGRIFKPDPVGSVLDGFLFGNVDAATNFVYDDTSSHEDQPASLGQLIWANTPSTPGVARTMQCSFRAWRLSVDQ